MALVMEKAKYAAAGTAMWAAPRGRTHAATGSRASTASGVFTANTTGK